MNRKVSQPFLLLDCFCKAWSRYRYEGEVYDKSPREFKLAKEYIELNENWNADNITAKAKIYLSKNGIYAENRHSFAAFINNIGTFVEPPKPRKPSNPELTYTCKNGHENKMLRSEWARYAGKQGKCNQCEEIFSVSDVLNDVPTIQNYIRHET